MLKGCTQYKLGAERFAKNYEDGNKNAAAKGNDYPYPVSLQMMSEQVGIKRKDDLIVGEHSATTELVHELRADRNASTELEMRKIALEERKLAIEEEKIALEKAKLGISEPDVTIQAEIPPLKEGVLQADVVTKRLCLQRKANGDLCQRTLADDEDHCFQHLPQQANVTEETKDESNNFNV